MDEAMGILEKLLSLLKSRRFWLYLARSIVAVLFIAAMVGDALGVDIGEVPEDEEALADQLSAAFARVGEIFAAVVALLGLLYDGRKVNADYTTRPAGVKDRVGLN